MRFKRIIALLLVFAMIIPTGLIHAADLVLKDDLNIMKYTSAGLRDLEDTIDVTDESYEAEIIVTFEYGEASYPPDYVQLSIVEENPVGKRIVGNTLFVDKGAPAGTITIKAVLPDNFYTTHTITVNSGGGTPQPAQPRIAPTPLDTSDLNHLIVSATALDGGIHNVQIRTFFKHAYGMVPGDIISLTREDDNSSVFSADITYQVKSKIREFNAYEMTYFFTMLDEDGGFLQYPEVIDMNSLEGALTVKLADPPDFSTAAIVEHTPPVVTSFDNIPATFKITQLQEGEVPTINVYYRSELTSDGLSIVKGMGQLTHVDGDTYTVNLADPEFKQMEAYTIEYYISTNRGYQWYYYPQGMNPYAHTGLYSTSIPRELYGSEEPEEPEEPESPEITRDDLYLKVIEASDLYLYSLEGDGEGQYSRQAKDALNDAIMQAVDVYHYSDNQAEIKNAHQMLSDAIEIFRAAAVTPFQAKISYAQRIFDYTTVGTDYGQYPAEARDTLGAAITSAKEWNNPTSTEAELEAAYQALDAAITKFLDSEIKRGDPSVLQEKIGEIWDFLRFASEGDGPGQYPSSAYTDLYSVIDAANVLIRNSGTEAQINEAYENLVNALQVFKDSKNPDTNKVALQAGIETARAFLDASEVGTKVGQYPADSKDILQGSIDAAWETLINLMSTQLEVDQALASMNNSLANFKASVIKAGDNTALQAAITEAKILLEGSTEGNAVGEYPLEAMDLLASAITNAENLANEEATQVAMDEAILTLNNAVAAFEAAVIKEGNSTELQLKIEAARNLLSFSAEGDRPGEYPSEAFDALDKAVEAAESLMDSPGTQQQIDDAHHDLVQAIEAFENAKIQEGEYAPLLMALSEAMTLYDTSPEGYGAGQYWPEVKALFMTAIEAANIVVGGPSTQEEIEEALQTLADAVEDFQKSVVRAGDSTNLQLAITDLTTLLSNSKEGDDAGEYPAGSKAILQSAVTAASNVISEPATQQEIDQAYEELIDAAGIFIAKIIPAGNISKALEKIYEVGRLLEASKAGTGVGQYPAEAIAALEAVFDAAIIVVDKPSSQVKLDATYQALVDAVDVFKKAQILAGDTEEADVVVTGAETLLRDSIVGEGLGEYPLAAKTTLEAAIAAAKEVFEQPATQAQIDTAKAALEAAVATFKNAVNKEGSSEEADAVVTSAETLLRDSIVGEGVGEYSLAAKTTLEAAIAATKEVLEQPATQAQIDTAKAALEAVITTFKNTVNKEGSSEEADAAVTGAETLLRDSIVGEGVGQYPLSAKTTLEAAIAAAKEVLEQPATQAQIDTAKAALEAAITTFKNTVNKEGSSEEADAAVTGAETLLRDSIVGEGVGQYPLSAKTTLEAAIAAAKEVFEQPATQAQIDTAKAALEAAITAFVAKVNGAGSSEEADAVVIGAETLLKDSVVGEGLGEYPLAAKTTLEAAIAAAKEVFENPATQAQIDEAKATLEAAIKTFEAAVNKEGSSEEADAAVTEAEALLVDVPVGEGVGQYPSEAVDVLKAAIKAAKEVFENPATQAQIDEAKATLEAAITTFEAAVNKEGSSEEADAAVTEAEALLVDVPVGEGVGQYPSEAVDVLKAAIQAAKEVFEHPATQAQIDEAKATLEAAIITFEAAVNTKGSSEEADAAVTEAETLLVDVPVGEGVGQYPAEAVDVLKAAIQAAKEVFDHPATQAQIDEAKATLEAAIKTFEARVNKEGSSEEADAAVTEAETLLVDVPVGEGVGQYPSEAVDVLKAAIKAAKEVFEHPATQAQIDEAKATLEAAITTFEAAVNKEGSSEAADAAVTEVGALLVDVPVGEGVGQYPSEAVDVLKAAIQAAKEVFDYPATQAQIDEAKATLEAAIKTFEARVNKEGSSEEADTTVTEAETLLVDVPVGEGVGQYPAEAVDVLKAAIQAAKEVFEHPATQAQIDEAKATLEAAIKTFEAAVNTKGSSEEAGAVVNEAQTLLKDSIVGEGVGQYPAEAVKALEAAMAAAKEVLEHPATQAQIDAAKATFEAAVAAFEAAVIKAGNAGEIQAQITEAATLLNESTEGNGVGQYPAGSKAILQAAITAAENVIRTAATQAEIDKANEQLTAAYNAFRAAVIKTAPVDSYTPPVNSYTPPVSTDTPPAATQPVTQPSTKITDGLNTVETGQGTVKTAASEVQEIMKAAKPVILESTLGVIDFGKNGLNVPELKLGLGASLELGILMTEKSKTDEVLAGAKLDQAGLQPLGGKVLDLIAQLNYSNGTSTRIKSFAEPVKVTINLKELGVTGDTTNLTAVRFVPQADGTYKTIKLGGVYIPATNSFEFYTDSFSLYSIVKADSVTKITFKVDSKEYSIGALAKQNDVPPVIQEQRTLVPIRAVAEALGAEVKWDHATKTATITLDGKVLTMTLGELIEGMDVPAQAIDGRIMVPLRYVSEALGAYVMWFSQDKRIEIIR
ncbi:hypothetical protein P40081_04185 [Paenibacillus sp. FSL P4-0081]|nr:hypothetical protein P40081_04185 [Paenibacillus sp. FSL P4-0081]